MKGSTRADVGVASIIEEEAAASTGEADVTAPVRHQDK